MCSFVQVPLELEGLNPLELQGEPPVWVLGPKFHFSAGAASTLNQ